MNQAHQSPNKIGLWTALRIWWTGNISPLQMATKQLQHAEVSLLDHEANREIYTSECEMLKARIKRLRKLVNDLSEELEDASKSTSQE